MIYNQLGKVITFYNDIKYFYNVNKKYKGKDVRKNCIVQIYDKIINGSYA